MRTWPEKSAESLRNLILYAEGMVEPGVIRLIAFNERQTIFLHFNANFVTGHVETCIHESGLSEQVALPSRAEIEHYARYFFSTFANGQVELCVEGLDPVECDIYIPMNMMMTGSVDDSVAGFVEKHLQRQAMSNPVVREEPGSRG